MKDLLNGDMYSPPPDPYLRIKRSDLDAGNARYRAMEAENKRLKASYTDAAVQIYELSGAMLKLSKILQRLGEAP